jgi:hypothetical protein
VAGRPVISGHRELRVHDRGRYHAAGQAGGGLYWLVPSVLAAVVFGLLNVWVLLVEILR